VEGLTGREVPVGWINDGLLVMRPGDPASPLGEIYRLDISTGRQSAWKNILPRDQAGFMVLGAFRVTPDGQSHAYSFSRALSNLYIADGLTSRSPARPLSSVTSCRRCGRYSAVCSVIVVAGSAPGTCNCGIGVVRKRRRVASPSHRAQRVDRATRALSVAMPVVAYICR
jgi:hypothetical protein